MKVAGGNEQADQWKTEDQQNCMAPRATCFRTKSLSAKERPVELQNKREGLGLDSER